MYLCHSLGIFMFFYSLNGGNSRNAPVEQAKLQVPGYELHLGISKKGRLPILNMRQLQGVGRYRYRSLPIGEHSPNPRFCTGYCGISGS